MSKVCAKCRGGLIYYIFGGWSHVDWSDRTHPPEPVDAVQIDMRKVDDVLRRAEVFFRARGKRKGRRR